MHSGHIAVMHFVLITVAIWLVQSEALNDYRRPIYNIGHMANSFKYVLEFLQLGANAVETDVTPSKNGSELKAYHGIPCDCFRYCKVTSELHDMMEEVRHITTPGTEKFKQEFVLWMLDVKMGKEDNEVCRTIGKTLANMLLKYLWPEEVPIASQLRIQISIHKPKNGDLLLGFVEAFRKANRAELLYNIGFDMSEVRDPKRVDKLWRELRISRNIWHTVGVTNCLPDLRPANIISVLQLRNSYNSLIQKACYWTVDRISTIRRRLRMEFDAIITNYPDRVVTVLKEPNLRNQTRVATWEDNPWEKIPSKLPMDTQEMEEY